MTEPTTSHSPSKPSEQSVAEILASSFDIYAMWTRKGMVVVRGKKKSSGPDEILQINKRFESMGWQVRWEPTSDEHLVFVEQARARTPWLAILLFLLTVMTVTVLRPFTLAGFQTGNFWPIFWEELPFAGALFPILLAHEFGHYFAARMHGYPASLPYFIPGFFPFGTFGAVIIARHPFSNRRVLFDVAVAGPIAGFLVCIPVLIYGLSQSTWILIGESAGMTLADPLLMIGLSNLVMPQAPAPDMDILLHPAAFGGWAGLFVTMLNLLPFGPLDGGKTVFAMIGPRQRWVAYAGWLTLCASLLYSSFWIIWLGLTLFLRLAHPPTLNDHLDIGNRRRLVGLLVILIFVLSFMPFPIQMTP